MKKSLLALAVLGAFAGAASAQTNVTLYGIADVGVGMSDKGGDSDSFLTVFSGVQSTSRFGIRGQEDLGGGLAATFNIEAGVNWDNGDADSSFWQRRAVVGLKGGFGEVRLGRDYTPGFSAAGATDVMGYGLFGNWLTFTAQGIGTSALQNVGVPVGDSAVFSGVTTGIDTRASNGIHYTSPAFGNTKCAAVPAPTECGAFSGGLTFTAMYAAGEADGSINTTNQLLSNPEGNGDMWGGAVVYRGGPLTLQGYYQTREFNNLAGSTGDKAQYGVGAQFVFGQFRIAGNYGYVEADTNRGFTAEKTGYGIGAGMKIGAGEILVNYIWQEFDSNLAAGVTPQSDTWGLAYVHPLSKRTNVYASYGQTANDDGAQTGINYSQSSVAASAANADAKAFAVGVRHLF